MYRSTKSIKKDTKQINERNSGEFLEDEELSLENDDDETSDELNTRKV